MDNTKNRRSAVSTVATVAAVAAGGITPNTPVENQPPEAKRTVLEVIRATTPAALQPEVKELLLSDLKAAEEAETAAETALTKAKSKTAAATMAICRAVGGKAVRIGGQVREFSCRGDLVFFKTRGDVEVVDF